MRKIIKCWNKREHEENDKILKRLSLHPSMLDIVFSSSSSNVAEEGVDVDILLNISGHVKTKSFPRAFERLMSSGGEIRLRLRRILLFTYSFGWDKTICCKAIQISSWILQKRRAGGKAFKGDLLRRVFFCFVYVVCLTLPGWIKCLINYSQTRPDIFVSFFQHHEYSTKTRNSSRTKNGRFDNANEWVPIDGEQIENNEGEKRITESSTHSKTLSLFKRSLSFLKVSERSQVSAKSLFQLRV